MLDWANRLAEASAAEEEGGLTAERAREIQRELEHNIVELEVADVEPLVEGYLPAAWFESGTPRPSPAWCWSRSSADGPRIAMRRPHLQAAEEASGAKKSASASTRLWSRRSWIKVMR